MLTLRSLLSHRVHTASRSFVSPVQTKPKFFTRHISSQLDSPSPGFAFAFDIDGVLCQGQHVLPAGKRALEILEGHNSLNRKIPYILMTNGGGVTDAERCDKLTRQLGVPLTSRRLVQSHTLLRSMREYSNVPVLVLGGRGNKGREIAESYGFKKAFIPLDVLAWNPDIWPFHKLTPEETSVAQPADFSQQLIHSVFVLHDPLNWSLDIQILCDVLAHGTKSRPPYALPSLSSSSEEPVELVFCNPDLIWRGAFELPRLGQGGFREAFQGVFKNLTGRVYPYQQYGKPTRATYEFAESMICELLGAPKRPTNIYMNGDNPESDIAGANAAKWTSILVHTGVYSPTLGAPSHTPDHQTADVEEAVRWAFRREFGIDA